MSRLGTWLIVAPASPLAPQPHLPATWPVAMATMDSVALRYGPSPKAFLLIALVVGLVLWATSGAEALSSLEEFARRDQPVTRAQRSGVQVDA